jgi:hypothetical protein
MSTWRYTSRISPVATFSQDAAPSPQTPPLQGALSAAEFVAGMAAARGFRADITHMAVHGWCSSCGGPQ